MLHIEGGWGKEINNPQDNTERVRGIGKLKAAGYSAAVLRMVDSTCKYVEQNNSGQPSGYVTVFLELGLLLSGYLPIFFCGVSL